MKVFGVLILIIGIIWLVIAFNLSTAVQTMSGSFVNNIGLMDDRRNHLLIAAVLIVCGAIFFGFGEVAESRKTSNDDLKKCPACAESIKKGALKCRYCGQEFDPSEVNALIAKQGQEEQKDNSTWQLIESKSNQTVICMGCKRFSPITGMYRNNLNNDYCHSGCINSYRNP